jgi:hypothetical protein
MNTMYKYTLQARWSDEENSDYSQQQQGFGIAVYKENNRISFG